MSDELASKTATLEQPSQDGQAERASGERPQGHTDGQPSENKGQAAQGSDENIRKLQSTYDKKLAEERKAFQAQQAQMQRHIQDLQREMREAKKNAAPDDFARLEIDLQEVLKERDQYAHAYQQMTQAQQAEQARQSALREVAEEFGVSAKDLEEATDYLSAVKLAVKVQRDREKQKQQKDEQRAADNTPDVGVGAPRTTMSEWERQYRDAQQRRDTAAQMRLLRTRPKQKGE